MKGILVAIVAWLPLGPVVFLCISRTLTSGVWSGIVSGLGASLSDAFYMAVIIFGLHSINTMVGQYEVVLHILGGIFLVGYALYLWRMPFQSDALSQHHTTGEYISDAASTFFLGITNPVQLITLPLIFNALGAQYQTLGGAVALYGAVVATLVIIAIGLPMIIVRFRTFIVGKGVILSYINKIAAGVLFLAGIASLIHTLEPLVVI